MKLRTFFGFLSPNLTYTHKKLALEELPLPGRSVLFIEQDDEKPGGPAVAAGSIVKGGQPLGSCGDSTTVSPVTGSVKRVYDVDWTNGEVYTAIEIETSEDELWVDEAGGAGEVPTGEPGELLALLEKAGFEMAEIRAMRPLDTVIVNGLESDLLCATNQMVLAQHGPDIEAGIGLLKQITGAGKALLAVTNDLGEAARSIGGAKAVTVPSVYPTGHPEILERTVAGKEGALGKCVVVSAELLKAMVDSARTGRPFTHKLVTLTGRGGEPEKNFKVRIGTPVSEVLARAGVELKENERLVLGGPMTGRAVYDTSFPISATTDAVFVQDAHKTSNISTSQCINCGKCVSVCPNKLPVNLLSRYAEFSVFEKCTELDIERCFECGLCAYVCTAQRPIVQLIQFARSELAKMKEEESEEGK